MAELYKFTVMFTEDEERMTTHIPGNWHYKINKTGTWLLAMLNTNIFELEEDVSKYNIDIEGFLYTPWVYDDCDPQNYKTVYQELVKKYPYISVFGSLEWRSIILEIFSHPNSTRSLSDSIDELKKFIHAADSHPEYFDYDFLYHYVLHGNIMFQDASFVLHIGESKKIYTEQDYEEMDGNPIKKNLQKAYNIYQDKKSKTLTRYEYAEMSPRLESILAVSLLELSRIGKVIRKCKNCGKYFIPENRSDTFYCDNPSPKDPTMSCKEYASRRLWYEKQKNDELATLSKNILSAKKMAASRNKDIPEYQAAYDYFRTERIKWKNSVKTGEKTRDEYREWLLSMRGQKGYKEDINAIHRKETN